MQKSGQSPDPFPGSGGANRIWHWHAIADVASCSCFPSAAAPARSLCPFQRGIVSLGCSHAPTYTDITLRSDWISACSAVFSDDGSMLVHMSFHPSWPATTGHLAKVRPPTTKTLVTNLGFLQVHENPTTALSILIVYCVDRIRVLMTPNSIYPHALLPTKSNLIMRRSLTKTCHSS